MIQLKILDPIKYEFISIVTFDNIEQAEEYINTYNIKYYCIVEIKEIIKKCNFPD